MGNIGMPEILLICIVFVFALIVIALVPYWKIFGKAGFSPWLSLLMVIPLVNFVMLYVLAFSEWPSLRQPPK
jgi:hypothetical protein